MQRTPLKLHVQLLDALQKYERIAWHSWKAYWKFCSWSMLRISMGGHRLMSVYYWECTTFKGFCQGQWVSFLWLLHAHLQVLHFWYLPQLLQGHYFWSQQQPPEPLIPLMLQAYDSNWLYHSHLVCMAIFQEAHWLTLHVLKNTNVNIQFSN